MMEQNPFQQLNIERNAPLSLRNEVIESAHAASLMIDLLELFSMKAAQTAESMLLRSQKNTDSSPAE